jgi:N-acetylglucosaminyl-diphospho-decaprenol L-rhamnosyltransferase
MDLSIIIINWNSANYLQKCLRSVYEHTRGIQMEVIVIDNASFDGARELVEREFPQVRFIQSEQNLGFAKGNNTAARQASGRWLLFLNPDTELHSPAINCLLDAAESLPQPGALGARLLNTDRTLQTSCVLRFPRLTNHLIDADILRRWFPRARIWGASVLYSDNPEPVPVERVSGACLMTLRSTFEQLGGFSEDYFMYCEDLEYCLKAHKAGRCNYYVPKAVLIHHGGKSSSQAADQFANVMMAEAGWRFFQKEHGLGWAVAFRGCLAVKAVSRLGLLALAYPLTWRENRRRKLNASISKYVSIARWAAGAERWAADKQQMESRAPRS